jgi:hypothetical protein
MLNMKQIALALSFTFAGTHTAFANIDIDDCSCSTVNITLKDIESDDTLEQLANLIDYVDGLGQKQRKVIQTNLKTLDTAIRALGKNRTSKDAHKLFRTFTIHTAKDLGNHDAKDLFSQDIMEPFVLAVTVKSTSDWVEDVMDTGLTYGDYSDDVDAIWDNGEEVFGFAGAIVGGLLGSAGGPGGIAAGTMLGYNAGQCVGALIDSANSNDDEDGSDDSDTGSTGDASGDDVQDDSVDTGDTCPTS